MSRAEREALVRAGLEAAIKEVSHNDDGPDWRRDKLRALDPAAIAATVQEAPLQIDYSVLHLFADDQHIDYNKLCVAVRSAIAAMVPEFEPWVGPPDLYEANRKLRDELDALRNENTLLRAQAEGVASQLLDVQQDCLTRAAIAATVAESQRPEEPSQAQKYVAFEWLREYGLSGRPGAEHAALMAIELAALRRDAERWRAGCHICFPEFCGHDDTAPGGSGWFHQRLDDRWFPTADEAIDAAISAAQPKTVLWDEGK